MCSFRIGTSDCSGRRRWEEERARSLRFLFRSRARRSSNFVCAEAARVGVGRVRLGRGTCTRECSHRFLAAQYLSAVSWYSPIRGRIDGVVQQRRRPHLIDRAATMRSQRASFASHLGHFSDSTKDSCLALVARNAVARDLLLQREHALALAMQLRVDAALLLDQRRRALA